MAEIHLQNLAHSYSPTPAGPEDYAIREMNHIWEQGGAYALLGPSGCGKSTLLNIISGLLSPSEGQVLFDNKVVNELDPEKAQYRPGFPVPGVVYDTMTVFDNLAFPLRNQGMAEAKVHSKVQEIAEVLDLQNLLGKKARNLSADEKQKVSMGRGLVRDDVSAILFDEPLTVIDPHLKWKNCGASSSRSMSSSISPWFTSPTISWRPRPCRQDRGDVRRADCAVRHAAWELFERPSHTFVGYFIGSPGMNLIEVQAEAGGARFAGTHLALSGGAAAADRGKGLQKLQVGIRPEFIHVWDEPNPDALQADVMHIEDLGTYKILTLNPRRRAVESTPGRRQTGTRGPGVDQLPGAMVDGLCR